MPQFTGWMNTDAEHFMDCPKCKAKAGETCQTPSGPASRVTHMERTKALIAEFGVEPWKVGTGDPAAVTRPNREAIFYAKLAKRKG